MDSNCQKLASSGRSNTQIFYWSKSSNTTVQKYSDTSKSPALKILLQNTIYYVIGLWLLMHSCVNHFNIAAGGANSNVFLYILNTLYTAV